MKEKEIRHEDYKTTLFSAEQMMHKQTRIVQKEHELFTVEAKKTSLSPFNDKKWITRHKMPYYDIYDGHKMSQSIAIWVSN